MTKFQSFSRLSRLPLCICIPQLLYLFLCWWTLRLLPHPGTYKECFYEIGVRASLWTSVVVLFGYIPSYRSAHRSHGSSIFNILRTFHVVLHSGCTNLNSPNSVRVFPFFYILTNISEKAMAPHSSTLGWKIPWTEEPGRLQSKGLLRVGHDWATSLSLFTFMHWRRQWQPTPVFLPGESQGQEAWLAAIYGVAQSRTRLKWLSSSTDICYLCFFCCCW